jgi:hypothetical protein
MIAMLNGMTRTQISASAFLTNFGISLRAPRRLAGWLQWMLVKGINDAVIPGTEHESGGHIPETGVMGPGSPFGRPGRQAE